ncbi:YbjN domain-containing protein [Sphingomonas sp.]|uniref:YbjN domain-containing protein n=1 Tax=Sphingomonas sp. TaxID=28214 RepID=UPI002ED95CB2
MSWFRITAMAAVATACALPAAAQTINVRDPELVAELLRKEGYQAKVDEKKEGEDPVITSAAAGSTFGIYFYNCEKGKNCQSVQFYAGFQKPKMDLARANAWNRDKRFGRAYIDKDGDAALEMDVNVEPGGMPRELFADSLNIWSDLIGEFRTRVYAAE